jgi:hypothetical protein
MAFYMSLIMEVINFTKLDLKRETVKWKIDYTSKDGCITRCQIWTEIKESIEIGSTEIGRRIW